MTRVWRSVFATVVTPDDDFFELGGNSLLAVRLIAEHQAAGLPDITIPDLYRWPTLSALARRLTDPPT
jgi:aryl carrier-like protein